MQPLPCFTESLHTGIDRLMHQLLNVLGLGGVDAGVVDCGIVGALGVDAGHEAPIQHVEAFTLVHGVVA